MVVTHSCATVTDDPRSFQGARGAGWLRNPTAMVEMANGGVAKASLSGRDGEEGLPGETGGRTRARLTGYRPCAMDPARAAGASLTPAAGRREAMKTVWMGLVACGALGLAAQAQARRARTCFRTSILEARS